MEINPSHISVGDGEVIEIKAMRDEVKKERQKKKEKGRSSAFCHEEEDSREIESWEYPDEISVESSVVSSLTGVLRAPPSAKISSGNEGKSNMVIQDKDTEHGGNNVSDPDTSLAESEEENSNLILNSLSENPKSKRVYWKKIMKPWYEIEKRHRALFSGILVLVIIIIIIIGITIVASHDTSRDFVPQGDTLTPREQTLMDLFTTVSPKGLDTKNSAQYLAREWIIHSDLLKLTPSETISHNRVLQRYILAVFYYSTGGSRTWKHNNWLEGDECSNMVWTGISCNDDNTIRAIAFDNAGLQGTLPYEIGFLTMLENLVIKNHPLLSGPIPTGIGNLQFLGQLGLYNNALTGEIPGDIYLATTLNYINFQNNELEGELAIQIDQMRNLERLILFNNRFSGKVPIRQLARTGIKFLGLSNNQFTGSIPEQISNLHLLEYLYMDNNEFTGSIPPNLGRLSSMGE